jgi:hypothetical protein
VYRRKAKTVGAEASRRHDRSLGRKFAQRHRFETANALDLRRFVQGGHNATAAATWAAMSLIFTLASIAAAWAGSAQ